MKRQQSDFTGDPPSSIKIVSDIDAELRRRARRNAKYRKRANKRRRIKNDERLDAWTLRTASEWLRRFWGWK